MADAAALPGLEPDLLGRAREKLIVALDFDTIEDARTFVETLGDEAVFYKIGMSLQLAGGDAFAKDLIANGNKVFLDYKYLDIEETVKTAVRRAAELGVSFLTVHGIGDIPRAAAEGRGASKMKVLCVTVLTCMDAQDVKEMGFDCDVERLVIFRAVKALRSGCDGVVASALEAGEIRKQAGDKLMIVSPGIRPAGSSADDQKRIATPASAIRAGADYLVVGRPITQAADPKHAARQVIEEMAAALSSR